MSHRIIVVEDEPAILRFVARTLERAGHVVTACQTGEEAIAVAESLSPPPTILIADQGLPGMKGVELAVQLHSVLPALRTIICSGFPVGPDELPTAGRSRFSFLQKPFGPDELMEAVEHPPAS